MSSARRRCSRAGSAELFRVASRSRVLPEVHPLISVSIGGIGSCNVLTHFSWRPSGVLESRRDEHMLRTTLKRHAPWAVKLWRNLRYRELVAGDAKAVFSRIYMQNHWGDAESVSGTGSNREQTTAIRAALPALLTSLGGSILDVPCGDFHWQLEAIPPTIRYIGGDIVPELIERNRAAYASRDFRVIDLIKDDLPASDVLLVRDCLVHLSFSDATRAIENIRKSNVRYLLATTFVDRTFNEDIPTGAWRPLNMQLAPFNFPSPLQLVDERCTGNFSDKALGVWRISDL